MTNTFPPIKTPGFIRLALEARAPFEFAAGAFAAPLLMNLPRGDGHPVIIYPGFLASDFSTGPLRRLLRHLGYRTYGWKQGRNLTPSQAVFDTAIEQIKTIHQKRGQKVSLVGWSLGGLYARELAKLEPDLVRMVVSLGSPFAGSPKSTNASMLFQWINGKNAKVVQYSPESLRQAPPVPTTSIYSRFDGVVPWQLSFEPASPTTESIEISMTSHAGMGVNPLVLSALADRLAQPEGQWQRYKSEGLRRLAYRTSPLPTATAVA
jgi:triacylglycerol esterase/lipase EstA (alpha/beta hydrolase family)